MSASIEPVADHPVVDAIAWVIFGLVITAPLLLLLSLPFVYLYEQASWPCVPTGVVRALSARCM